MHDSSTAKVGPNQPLQRTPLRSAASLGLSVHKAIYPSARRTKCLNLGQAVSAVTKTCRPNPPKLASVRSSAPSARHAPTLFSAASAQTAEVSWSSALGVRLTSLPIIHPQPSASTIPLVARRPHSAVNAPRALSVLIVIAHPERYGQYHRKRELALRIHEAQPCGRADLREKPRKSVHLEHYTRLRFTRG